MKFIFCIKWYTIDSKEDVANIESPPDIQHSYVPPKVTHYYTSFNTLQIELFWFFKKYQASDKILIKNSRNKYAPQEIFL